MSGGEAGFHKGAEEAHTRQSGLNDGKSAQSSGPHQPPIRCPECTSQRVWKDGVRATRCGDVQRYVCRSCGYRFSESKVKFNVTSKLVEVPNPRPDLLDRGIVAVELSLQKLGYDPPLFLGEDISSHKVTTVGQDLNSLGSYSRNRRVCVSERETKNLSRQRTRQKRAAGATTQAEIKGKLVEYSWWMKKEGFAESTITRRVRLLKTLSKRGADLLDPESVKLTIARQEGWNSTTKEHAVTAYTSFLKMLGGTWKPPKYNRVRKLPFIPTEQEVNELIAGCNRKTSAFLKLLKETGMRSGEAWNLEWTDFNFENGTVSITPEKGSDPRVLGISIELIAMLKALPKTSHKVFPGSLRHFGRSFRRQRKRIAHKLQNPRVNRITFHSLRHWKATMEYHRTKDILHVKQLLGHKSINSTLMYTQLVNFKEDEFHVRIAKNVKEACELVEAGFEYVTGEYEDGGKIFRKRK